MNMIVNSSDLVGYEAENLNRETTRAKALNKLVKAWESKQGKTAKKVGGLSLLAVSLAACNSEDTTPFSQSDLDAAVKTAVDAKEAEGAALLATAVATAKSQGLAEGAVAGKAAGLAEGLATVTTAVNAALTDSSGVKHDTVDAAITSDNTAVMMTQADYDAAIDAADDDEQATIDNMNASVTNAGFANLDAFIAAYTDLTDGSALAYTNSTVPDALTATVGPDTITAALGTYANTDSLVDVSTTDNDTVTITHNAAVTPVITNVENVNLNLNATGAANVTASSLAGVNTLTITRGDVTVGSAIISGDKTIVVTGLDAADVGTVVAGAATTTVSVTQATTTGVTVNADTASGNVTLLGAGTVNAAGAGTGDTVTVRAALTGAVTTEATENAKAVVINTGAATVVSDDAGGGEVLDGTISITANSATSVTVDNASGGLTLSATADNAQIRADNIDASGASITVGTGVATAGNSDIDLDLDGSGLATDAVTVAGAGPIDLDVNGTGGQLIETVNLSGTTAAVDYNMVTSIPTTINMTGAQSVTVSNTGDALNNLIATDSLTAGTTTYAVNTAATGAVTATNAAFDNFILEADAAFDATGSGAITVTSGSTFTIAADQTGLDIVGSAAGATINLVTADDTAANGTAILLELDDVIMNTNITTVNVEATVGAFDADSITLATTGALNLSGTQAYDLGNATAASVTSTSTGAITLNTANASLDAITTGNGADQLTLDEAAAVMVLSSGEGADVVSVGNAAASQYDLGGGNDQITITNANSGVIAAGAGNDTIIHNAGIASDMIIAGGDGSDTLRILGGANINVSGNTNFAISDIETINLNAAGGGLQMSAAQFNGDNAFALTGTAAATDIMTITGSAAADTINMSGVTVTNASTNVTGGAGDDTITGTAGVDVISGGAGSDAISGGTGTDTVSFAGAANTTDTGTQVGVVVNLGTTALTSSAIAIATGDLTANSTSSVAANTSHYLYATAVATNSAVSDTLNSMENVVGSQGTDYIVGSAGANSIDGDAGRDTVTGGLGADTFVFAAGDSGQTITTADVITDYTTGTDLIDVTAVTLTLVAEGTLGAGQAAISAAGVASFNAADNTDALRIVATEAGMTAATAAAGETAIFQSTNAANSFIFISDGVANVGANDILIHILGDAAGNLTLTGGDISAIA